MHVKSFFTSLLFCISQITALPNLDPDTLSDSIDTVNGTSINTLVKRQDCWGQQCVTFYRDQGCTASLAIGSYAPDCSGHCFQYDSFGSISLRGNDDGSGIFNYKTNCHAYRDYNCQSQITESGNKGSREYCMENLGKVKSMKCYFHC